MSPICSSHCRGRLCVCACVNGFQVDVANRTFPCQTEGSGPLMQTKFSSLGNNFQRLLADFPLLKKPGLSATVTKHSIEHFIPTMGLPVFSRVLP